MNQQLAKFILRTSLNTQEWEIIEHHKIQGNFVIVSKDRIIMINDKDSTSFTNPDPKDYPHFYTAENIKRIVNTMEELKEPLFTIEVIKGVPITLIGDFLKISLAPSLKEEENIRDDCEPHSYGGYEVE